MPPARFETAMLVRERPQTEVLDRAAKGIGDNPRNPITACVSVYLVLGSLPIACVVPVRTFSVTLQTADCSQYTGNIDCSLQPTGNSTLSIFQDLKMYYFIHRSLPFISILSIMNTIHIMLCFQRIVIL
jgi:hypothetical protein